MKKSLWIILTLMACIFAFTSCDKFNIQREDVPAGSEQSNGPTNPSTVCQHAFPDWSIAKQATCKEEGIRTRTCDKCAYVEEVSIPKNETHTVVTDTAVPAT